MQRLDTQKSIMLVDNSITNLRIAKSTLGESYNLFTLNSSEKLFRALERILPDLIILSVEMADIGGYDALRRLKADRRTEVIPVVMLTSNSDEDSELEGLTLGAVDYIIKPFSPPVLKKRVEIQMALRQYNESLLHTAAESDTLRRLQIALFSTIAEAAEFRAAFLGEHIDRIKAYLRALVEGARQRGIYANVIDYWNMEILLEASTLHDVGKLAISDGILLKGGELTPDEFEHMKLHVERGADILRRAERSISNKEFTRHAKAFVETHHERWDGGGYPAGLRGEEIPLQGRLLAVADAYDALTRGHAYRRALGHAAARDAIWREKGGQFDPALVEVFQGVAGEFEEIYIQYT